MWESVGDWRGEFIQWLGTSGGLLANAIQIWAGIVAGGSFVFWLVRKRVGDKDRQIANLQRDIPHREETSQADKVENDRLAVCGLPSEFAPYRRWPRCAQHDQYDAGQHAAGAC
jgi:hypothetical protein